MNSLIDVLCCPALSPQITGTGDVVPDTTKLSETHRCSAGSGCAIENASKSSLEKRNGFSKNYFTIHYLLIIPKLANVGCQAVDGRVALPGGCIRSWISLVDKVRIVCVNNTLASLGG
jgi:hypothetical protein